MKNKLVQIIRTKPFFLFLLPVFFVLHGAREYLGLVPPLDAIWLTLTYLGICLIFLMIFWLVYKNYIKASLMCFFIMSIYFFFGSIHDTLKNIFEGSFITKYSSILPSIFFLLLGIFVFLKKSTRNFYKTSYFLNFLFILLIGIESTLLIKKLIEHKSENITLNIDFTNCTNCNNPDIYLIIADEYTNNQALQEKFNFDNSAFETELMYRGFYIIKNSKANYNATVYSMASMLNLKYLDNLVRNEDNIENITNCFELLKNNQTLLFLKKRGYDFYNFSDFDFHGQPAINKSIFLPTKTNSITSQTLISRIYRDLWYHLATDLKLKSVIKNVAYAQLRNNNKILGLTKTTVSEKNENPKFVYTHLIMPHNPYYYDKNGTPVPLENFTEKFRTNRKAYSEYLQYSNKKLLDLVDNILSSTTTPPVILLMGDHGFRMFNDTTQLRYTFMNFSSIFLPGKKYDAYYDSISSVNQIRTLLNVLFKQQLPMLKDSLVPIKQ